MIDYDSYLTYLEEKGHCLKGRKLALTELHYLENWLVKNKLTINELTYENVLAYIDYLQQQGSKQSSIKVKLGKLSLYYQHKEWDNPFLSINIRGVKQEQAFLLTEKELDHIYDNWKDPSDIGYFKYSHQLILGLFIYQGLVNLDIENLRLEDIDLKKGTIYIRPTNYRKRGRTLTLQVFQILAFHEYIESYRGIGYHLQTGNKPNSEKLFSPNCDKRHRFTAQTKEINKQLRNLYQKELGIKKACQLQQSRLAIWIQQHGIRKAQYLSGYRCIKTLERYKKENVQYLKGKVLKYHPLG